MRLGVLAIVSESLEGARAQSSTLKSLNLGSLFDPSAGNSISFVFYCDYFSFIFVAGCSVRYVAITRKRKSNY